MQIINFNFKKIQAEKKELPKGKIEISSNINIISIKQEELGFIKEKPVLRFDFDFTVDFKPNIASLSFQGSVLGIVEKNEAKEILKNFKTKKIADKIRIPLFNFILAKCNIKSLQFEEEFNLPFHIPLPRIQQQQQQNSTNYAG